MDRECACAVCDQVAKPTEGELAIDHEAQPLRSFCMNAARSTAISTHAPQPRDSAAVQQWPGPCASTPCFASAPAIHRCQADQPRDSWRLIKWRSARDILIALAACCARVQSRQPPLRMPSRELAVDHEAQALAQLLHERRTLDRHLHPRAPATPESLRFSK